MKKSVIVVFLLFFIFLIANADTIILKNGDMISGKIIFADEKSVIIETDYGKLIVDKEKIDSVKYGKDDKVSKGDENKSEEKRNEDKDKNEASDKRKKDAQATNTYYRLHRDALDAGIALIIPGAICTLVPLVLITPMFLALFSEFGYSLFNNSPFVFGFSWYIIIMAIGGVLDISAIITFAYAGYNYDKWINSQKSAKVKIYSGFVYNKAVFMVGLKI